MKELIYIVLSLLVLIVLFGVHYAQSKSLIVSDHKTKQDKSFFEKFKTAKDLLYCYLLIALLIVVIIICYHIYVKKLNSAKLNDFSYLFKLIRDLFAILFSAAVIIQVLNLVREDEHDTIESYSKYSREFLDDSMELFLQHPDMNYYYLDLMGVERINENTNRDITKELELSMLIYSKFAKVAVFEENTYSDKARTWIHHWLGKSFNSFMESPTFRSYYPLYKEKLAGPAIINYMHYFYKL